MTIHEVSAILKVTEETVRHWIHARDLRAFRFEREWRVAVRDLEKFLNARANREPAD